MAAKSKPFGIRLDPPLLDAIQARAQARRVSRAQIINEAISAYLQADPSPDIEKARVA